MPAPPPPPPPPPPLLSLPTNSQPLTTQKVTGARAMLLTEIHKGTRLKKTVTNDRSLPAVEGKIVGDETNNNKACAGRTAAAPSTVNQKTMAPKPAGAMNLGDLFKDGVPRKPSDLKNQKSLSANQIASSNTLSRNDYAQQQKPKDVSHSVKKAPLALTSDNVKAVENNHSKTLPSTEATANKSTRAAAIANLQKSISSSAPPPPLPAKLPKQKLTVAQQPSKLPLSQQNQFQTLRPTKTQPNSDENRTPLRRTGSTEELQKRPSAPPPPPMIRRPGGPPPPPPPMARHAQMASVVIKKVEQPTNSRIPTPQFKDKCSTPLRGDMSPPLPPPRVSSYLESMEQRFHFVPLSELPPPSKFVGFRKDYNCLYTSK